MTKKIERVTVAIADPEQPLNITYYRLSCGDTFEWMDRYPPTFCPFCGRMIDYAGPEEEGEQ